MAAEQLKSCEVIETHSLLGKCQRDMWYRTFIFRRCRDYVGSLAPAAVIWE